MLADGSMTAAPGSVSEDLTWAPAWQIREWIVAGRFSALAVCEHFLARIERLDPQLHAFRHVDAEGARAAAKEADARQARGDSLGPLHGVPLAVKDHVRVAGLPYFGMPIPGETGMPVAREDDTLVARLRAAGAILVGTTVMPGMGNSPLGGPSAADLSLHARNPWDLSRVPGSSSAGSSAATAAAMLPVTVGSDGGGSTRLPAALCGVVGVHTARGRIPSVNFDAPAPMLTVSMAPITRDVRDAAIMMSVMAGPDGSDFVEIEDDAPDYQGALDLGVDGLRFAWTGDFGYGGKYALAGASDIIASVKTAAEGFRSLGGVVDPTEEVWEDFWPGYVAMGMAYNDSAMAGRGKATREDLKAGVETRARNWRRFTDLFERYDILLSPTLLFTAMTVEEWDAAWNRDGERYPHGTFAPTYTVNTHMFNWLGWPALSIPCGFIDGLPVGLQLVTKPTREALLYRAAAAFAEAYPQPERPPCS